MKKCSNSIKVVMPSLVSDIEEAYYQPQVVHNGWGVLSMFLKMFKIDENEKLELIWNVILLWIQYFIYKVLNKLCGEMKN